MNGIAQTLANLPDDKLVRAALDRTQSLDEIVSKIVSFWRPNISKRNPAPAWIEGEDGVVIYQDTDLDMFTVLLGLEEIKDFPTEYPTKELYSAIHSIILLCMFSSGPR